jgi:DNA-binding transcriptional MerR regulator
VKSPEAFRTISEAATELGVPQHVLRFWETKFSFIRPMKRAGGRRFYRRQDIDVLRGVRTLLHDEGYTIKGVQRLHKEHGVRRVVEAVASPAAVPSDAPTPSAAPDEPIFGAGPLLGPAARVRLNQVLEDLDDVRARLDALLSRENS